MAERVIPHSNDAERSVLGAAMLDERALIEVAEKVKPADFYNKSHQEIYQRSGKQRNCFFMPLSRRM